MSDKKVEEIAQVDRIRITLTSGEVKPLEKVVSDLVNLAKQKNIKVRGPVRMPTRTLKITTRKTPCGEGSKTWDRLQMKVHKRVLDLTGAKDIVQKINSITIEPAVYFEVTASEAVQE